MSTDVKDLRHFENYQHPDRFGELLGYKIALVDRDRREARVDLKVRGEHMSAANKLHGGVISALLDFACGVAVCTTLGKADLCSTVELKVNYFRPVLEGEDLEATAKVVFRGKKLCALTALLRRKGQDEPVAMASATYNVIEGNGGSTS